MKTRQFRQLAGKEFLKRLPLLVEGLDAIAANICHIDLEADACVQARAFRAAEVLRNLGREEAGKFLILIDSCRAPESDQATISRQFGRAGNHLAKLIYAQIADYSIASQGELVRAVDRHRQALYLDGPNDFDWIFPNELIAERETALYVDLVESEGMLGWSSPHEYQQPLDLPRSIHLVKALAESGIVSVAGLSILQECWRGFDSTTDTHYSEWARRTAAALGALPELTAGDESANTATSIVEFWPMPMVAIDLARLDMTPEELAKRRKAQLG